MSTAIEKTVALKVLFDNIPLELTRRDQWVTWQDRTKTPYIAGTNRKASSTDRSTWRTFDEAKAAYVQGTCIGIGYVFSGDDNDFVGVDLDHCHDAETGKILPWSEQQRSYKRWKAGAPDPLEIIERCSSYSEVSPSNTGIKIFTKGPLARCGKAGDFEIYDRGRYFTVTGHTIIESGAGINDCNGAIDDLVGAFLGEAEAKKEKTRGETVISNGAPNDDGEILTRIAKASNAAKVEALLRGEWEANYPSQSEADAALCSHLAFYCGRDVDRIDRMFRSSGLNRDKWEQREDYRERTIAGAIEKTTEFYNWGRASKQRSVRGQASSKPGIANFVVTWTKDADGKPKKNQRPMDMRELLGVVNGATDDWPRRVGRAMFVHADDAITWLETANAMFGWLGSAVGVAKWSKAIGCITKGELFAELRRKGQDYRAVELHPRVPSLSNVYCTYPTPKPGDGTVLRELLDCFSPATDIDRDLIQAAFMTGMWGGPPGARPAFVFTSDEGRGKGKTTVAQMVGRLYGGTIDFSTKDNINDIKERLLSSEASVKRIALIDNIKSLRFSWGDLEGLITSDEINGRKMYVGDASRPNTMTWFLTLNGASLSTDMAQRAVLVKVKNPKRTATWEEDTTRFIEERRAEIIADLVGCLLAEQYELPMYSRWATWDRGVLSRLPEPAEAQKVILERQAECDAEAENNSIIEDHFGQQLERLGYATDREEVFIPSEVAARWLNWATNDRQKTQPASSMLKQMIGEGSVKRLRQNKCMAWGRGFVWEGENADIQGTVHVDLIQRLSQQSDKNKS